MPNLVLKATVNSRFAELESDAVRNFLAIINPSHFIQLPGHRRDEATLFWQAPTVEEAADTFFKRLHYTFLMEKNQQENTWIGYEPPPGPHRLSEWPDNLETLFSVNAFQLL